MGVTGFSLQLLNKHKLLQPGSTMLELGCQNLYNPVQYGQIARHHFEAIGIDVVSIDITGCQGAEVEDLTKPFDRGQFDLVTDFGTTEHVAPGGLYQARKNVHNACKVGGIMVHENPKTGNWPGHGNHYVTKAFYTEFAYYNGYKIIDIGEHAAMGNDKDGWNVYCVIQKLLDKPFVERDYFNLLDCHCR